ncbi:MAG: hypothetical protein E6I58_06805 [Chloroflexi bacterium]|nr:MAG: hypothetical protein E6I58_06805 [Chloroflexota bacterium]
MSPSLPVYMTVVAPWAVTHGLSSIGIRDGITGRWMSCVMRPVPGPLTVQRVKLSSTTFVSTK